MAERAAPIDPNDHRSAILFLGHPGAASVLLPPDLTTAASACTEARAEPASQLVRLRLCQVQAGIDRRASRFGIALLPDQPPSTVEQRTQDGCQLAQGTGFAS